MFISTVCLCTRPADVKVRDLALERARVDCVDRGYFVDLSFGRCCIVDVGFFSVDRHESPGGLENRTKIFGSSNGSAEMSNVTSRASCSTRR